ncbi:MAG: hypothetical protein AB7E95_04650 [Kiritimatiellales bacterium]
MKPLRFLRFVLPFCLVQAAAVSADTYFNDAGYTGVVQAAQWEYFSYASTNAGVGNAPQYEIGEPNAAIRQLNPALITSGGNIYSFSSDMSFELSALSTNELGEVCLQVHFWGPENALSNTVMVLEGVAELAPSSSTNFYRAREDFGEEEAYHMGYMLTWNLSEQSVTDYAITFDLLIHTSLDRVRLDTEAKSEPTTPVEPAEPPELELIFDAGEATLSFAAQAGVTYQVYHANALAESGWTEEGLPFIGSGSTWSITNASSDSTGFYRVEAWREE